MDHRGKDILWEFHEAVVRGHVGGKSIARKVLHDGLWWPTIFKDSKGHAKCCDVSRRVGKPFKRGEFPLHPVKALPPFEKWVVDFVGPVNP